ncbi:MAG: hypothetical protein GYA50_06445 [Eubacteriaceae bacterium]|nr:hypothetical protein [Eubacteriaceae bacterium]
MFNKRLGLILLGIWLIVTGLLKFISIPVPYLGSIMAVIAIVAGILILLSKK